MECHEKKCNRQLTIRPAHKTASHTDDSLVYTNTSVYKVIKVNDENLVCHTAILGQFIVPLRDNKELNMHEVGIYSFEEFDEEEVDVDANDVLGKCAFAGERAIVKITKSMLQEAY